VNTLVTAVAALLGLLLAVLIAPWAVVAVGLLGAIRMVASMATAVADGVRGRARPVVLDDSARSAPASGREVVDPVPETRSGDVLDHAHVRIGRVG
jgi:hypothetical protein